MAVVFWGPSVFAGWAGALPFPVPPALLVLAEVVDGPIVESCEFSTSTTMLFLWITALGVGRAQRNFYEIREIF